MDNETVVGCLRILINQNTVLAQKLDQLIAEVSKKSEPPKPAALTTKRPGGSRERTV